MVTKTKCLCCKKKKELVDRSDYCRECYDIIAARIARAVDKTRGVVPTFSTRTETKRI